MDKNYIFMDYRGSHYRVDIEEENKVKSKKVLYTKIMSPLRAYRKSKK